MTEPAPLEGLVLRIDAKVCHVEVGGQRRTVPLAGKLFEERSHEKRPLAVGDRVQFDVTGQAIDALLPRTSMLHRRAASEGEERSQVVASNVTLVLAVASAAEPPFQPELIDGVLAGAVRQQIPAALILTKIDRDKKGTAQQWIDLYRKLGYRVFGTCTQPGLETHEEFAQLRTLLHENRTVLCGLSGVGKSTLLNALVPGLQLRTGSLNHIRQGCQAAATCSTRPACAAFTSSRSARKNRSSCSPRSRRCCRSASIATACTATSQDAQCSRAARTVPCTALAMRRMQRCSTTRCEANACTRRSTPTTTASGTAARADGRAPEHNAGPMRRLVASATRTRA
jgi:ribosome small subunit-dependent GTPase A